MRKPLIVMALESEGQGKLEPLGFEVLYCGVGKVNAAYRLTRRLWQDRPHCFPYVLNFGSAGSPVFTAGTLVAAKGFIQRDMDASALGFALGETPFDPAPLILDFPTRFAHLPHGLCGSGDAFLQGMPPVACDIIDMEAYALAKVCRHESIPFTSVKYITDGADGNAHADWRDNLRHAAQAFAELCAGI